MKLELVPIKDLITDPSNARKHNERNIDAIKFSLTRFGQRKNIVVNQKNIVIAGNGTLEAARQLGWTEIAVDRVEMSQLDQDAFAIADNRTADLAEWDVDILNQKLDTLRDDFDLMDLGWLQSEIPSFLVEDSIDPEDDSEDAKEDAKLILTVSCKDEDEQQMLFLELRDRGFKVKA